MQESPPKASARCNLGDETVRVEVVLLERALHVAHVGAQHTQDPLERRVEVLRPQILRDALLEAVQAPRNPPPCLDVLDLRSRT